MPQPPIIGNSLRQELRPPGPVRFDVSQRPLGPAVLVEVRGELDVQTASRMAAKLNRLVRQEKDLVFDLTETVFIDSVGLHTLLNVQRRLTRRGHGLTVVCDEGPVRRVIELARLSETLGVVSSQDDYLARSG